MCVGGIMWGSGVQLSKNIEKELILLIGYCSISLSCTHHQHVSTVNKQDYNCIFLGEAHSVMFSVR